MKRLTKGVIAVFASVVVLLAALAGGCAFAADPEVSTILDYQKEYFNRIQSIELSAKLSVTRSEEAQKRTGNPATSVDDLKYIHEGDRFWTEVYYRDSKLKKRLTKVQSYDGQLYQMITLHSQAMLKVTRDVSKLPAVYVSSHPLLFPFDFCWQGADKPQIRALQDADRWSKLCQAVSKTENINMLGHDGKKISFVGSAPCGIDGVQYEVFFASDLEYFPVYWKAVLPSGDVSEYQAVTTKTYDAGTGKVVIPVRAVVKNYFSNGVVGRESTFEIDTATLKINQSVAPEAFRIAMDKAKRYVDLDSGVSVKL